jgi:isocitrate dehydrogenase (NAD+)
MKAESPAVRQAGRHFEKIVEGQLVRAAHLRLGGKWIDYAKIKPLVVAVVGGDGIGPVISREARRVLEFLLKAEIDRGAFVFKTIEGLTIENRARTKQAIPDDVLREIAACPIILKGPTTTPREGDGWPNIESANVAMRRALDLFANVRPVRVPAEGIDWTFFRENTEGAYILGSSGFKPNEELAFDFTVATRPGCERIIRLAFEYAKKNGIGRVTAVTKANVIKATDGLFLDVFYKTATEYPEIQCDDWYIDIMTAKLIDPARRQDFKVVVLPNLYGDILTDEAAQFQGGVGTAGSANIGWSYAMFEAIHGSAPRMVKEGRAEYADPFSMIRAGALLLKQVGMGERANQLEMALDVCGQFEKKIAITGRPGGATATEISDYLMETLQNPKLEEKWRKYQPKL